MDIPSGTMRKWETQMNEKHTPEVLLEQKQPEINVYFQCIFPMYISNVNSKCIKIVN